jgi:hypothetical protein
MATDLSTLHPSGRRTAAVRNKIQENLQAIQEAHARGVSLKTIAQEMGISFFTFRTYFAIMRTDRKLSP